MNSRIRDLLVLMHQRKATGKVLTGSVCIEAIRKKFPEHFDNTDGIDNLVEEADKLFEELNDRFTSRASRKRELSCDRESDDSVGDDLSCELEEESSSDSEIDSDGSQKSTDLEELDAGEKISLLDFMKRAGLSIDQGNESNEVFQNKLIEICKTNGLDHEDLSKNSLNRFLAKQELKALEKEADITLDREERKGRNEFGSKRVPQGPTSCSSLVDE